MVKQVRYSKRALADREKILKYWINHNGNVAYSKKLFESFQESISILKSFPNLGKLTNKKGVRFLVVSSYKFFYKVTPQYLLILGFWDTRRNPKDMKY